jgi:hypothetical protein
MSHANALPSSIFYVMIDIHIVNCSLCTLIWLITPDASKLAAKRWQIYLREQNEKRRYSYKNHTGHTHSGKSSY